MISDLKEFSETARTFSRSPLGIIALFIVLVYGIAGLVLGSSGNSLENSHKTILVWFLVLFPLVVLATFSWLVTKHHRKLYAPSDFRNDEGFLRALGPEEQRLKLERETEEVIASDQSGDAPHQQGIVETSSVKSTLLLAEELALREVQSELGVQINRQVSIGVDLDLDGVFAKGGSGYGVEVKYIRKDLERSSLHPLLRNFASSLRKYNYNNFQFFLVLVTDEGAHISPERIENLAKYANELKVPFQHRIYKLRDLREKYGA